VKSVLVKINAEKCKGCNLCVSVCPKNVLASDRNALNQSGYYAVEVEAPELCIGCTNCALMCPDGAIGLYRQ
jgi:2-oxoglutarate ferredoxin oxidoreductase subunit delta